MIFVHKEKKLYNNFMRTRGAKYQSIFNIIFSKSKIIIVFALIFIVFISVPVLRKINQKNALSREIRELETQAQKIEQKNNELNEVINYLQSNAFAEKEARVNLDLQKQGEKVVIIQDESLSTPKQTSDDTVFIVPGLENTPTLTEPTNIVKWQDYFFSVN